MKVINIILAVLFALFAIAQLNDLDPWAWTIFYGFVAVVSGFAAFGKYNTWVLLGGLAVCVIWTITLIPEFVNWIQMGMPTITGKMKATEPHIEYTREFLGLFISAAVLYWHYAKARHQPAALI